MDEFFASNRLSAYIDGELSPSERDEVEGALRDNSALREEYESLLAAVDFVHTHGPLEVPPGFHTRVIAITNDLPMPGGFWARIRGWFAAAPLQAIAVAAAALIVVGIIGQTRDAETPLAPEPGEAPLAAAPPSPEAAAQPGPEAEMAEPEDALAMVDDKEMAMPPTADGKLGNEKGSAGKKAPSTQRKSAMPSSTTTASKTTAKETSAKEQTSAPAQAATGAPLEADQPTDGDMQAQLASSVSYRLGVSDPDALRELLMLANRYGATIVNSRTGAPLEPAELGGDLSRVPLSVTVPQDQLTSFAMALRSVGELTTASMRENELHSGGNIKMHLDVVYSGEKF